MQRVLSFFKRLFAPLDKPLLITSSLLSLVSLLTLAGAMEYVGTRRMNMQIAMTVIGFILMIALAQIDFHVLVEKGFWWLILFSAAFLAATLVFGVAQNGETNKSWIAIPGIGFNIQPSEFVKTTFILSFSGHLEFVKDRINHPLYLLSLLIHAGLIIGLIALSGDLGVALVFVAVMTLMLLCTGMSPWYAMGGLGLVGLAAPILWNRLVPYQQKRILVGFNPDLDPYGTGWQQIVGRRAIANGGFFGKGLTGGSYYLSLSAAHTDFFFATFCEKFGFFGGTLLIGAEVYLLCRLVQLSRQTRQDYGSFICIGAAAVVFAQTVENLGMCLAVLPVVGITLPFMSYGGSSVLGIYFMMGIVQSVAAHSKARTVIPSGSAFGILAGPPGIKDLAARLKKHGSTKKQNKTIKNG